MTLKFTLAYSLSSETKSFQKILKIKCFLRLLVMKMTEY